MRKSSRLYAPPSRPDVQLKSVLDAKQQHARLLKPVSRNWKRACARKGTPEHPAHPAHALSSSHLPYGLVTTTAVSCAPAMAMASISINAPGIPRLPLTVERAG